jgi:hypothetical protein
MDMKKFGIALVAIVVLGAIVANSAFAANEYKETGGAWYVGGSKLAEGTTKALTTTQVGTSSLDTVVAGTTLNITWTGTNCLGCTIKNTGTTATADVQYEYTGVSVTEPANCSTTSTLQTVALTTVVGMNTGGTVGTHKLTPQSGTSIMTITLSGTNCPIAGTYKVFGTIFSKTTNATGVFATEQEDTTSKAIQEAAGTSTSLKFGENAAVLTSSVKSKLSPETSWGAKEK